MKKVEQKLNKVLKEEKKLKTELKHVEAKPRRERTVTKQFRKDPELRAALMSAYFPGSATGDLVFPKPVGNYDATGYQAMDKTIHNINHTAAAVFVAGQVATQSNFVLMQGFGTGDANSFNNFYTYDRQFPDIAETHNCRLLSLSVTFEMVTGSLANTTGNLTVALVPVPETWGEITGPIWRSEDLALMHGSSVLTAAEIAAQPITMTWARIGSLADSFKRSVSMSFALNANQRNRIEQACGFTHNPSRLEKVHGKTLPGLPGDNYLPTKDVLIPTWVSTFSAGTSIRVTIERYWDVTLVPQDTAVMTSLTDTGRLSDRVSEKLAKVTHQLPLVPAPTPSMPAEMIINNIATALEKGGKFIEDNEDNIRTAAAVFGTTVKIGSKLAGMLL